MLGVKSKIYILIGGFVIFSIILAIFAARPFLLSLAKASGELSQNRIQLALLEKQLSILNNFQDKNSVYQKSISSVESAIVPTDAPIDFIEFLEHYANDLDLSLTIYPSALQKDAKFHTMFRVVIEGPFSECLSFLALLENSYWLIEISGVDVTRFSEIKDKNKESQNTTLQIGDTTMSLMVKALKVSTAPSGNSNGDKTNEGT